MSVRRALKILHEVASAGIIGALAVHIVLLVAARPMGPVEYAAIRQGIDLVARWVLLPSLALVLLSGLLAMAVHSPFHNAGWAWLKAATGVLMLEGTLGAINATARDAALLAAKVARGEADGSAMADVLRHEWGGLWVILGLSLGNVVLGVWRPRLTGRTPKP
jgi:hypothetical protein